MDHRGRMRRNDDLQSEVEGWILIEQTILLKHYGRSEMLTCQMQKKKKKTKKQLFRVVNINNLYHMRNDWRSLRAND